MTNPNRRAAVPSGVNPSVRRVLHHDSAHPVGPQDGHYERIANRPTRDADCPFRIAVSCRSQKFLCVFFSESYPYRSYTLVTSFSSEWLRIRLMTNLGTPPLAIKLAAVRRRSWPRMSALSRTPAVAFDSLMMFARVLCARRRPTCL